MKRIILTIVSVLPDRLSGSCDAADVAFLRHYRVPSSQFNGMSIGGLAYELRIFLDTDLVPLDFGTPDIQFSGPHQGEIGIATLGTLPLNPISRVLYHAPGGLGNPVTEVQFYAPAFNAAHFASSVTNDSEHLWPDPR